VLAGVLEASARGFTVNSDRLRPWFALALGPFVDGPFPFASRIAPLNYRLAVAAVVPLHAEIFSVTGAGSAYATPPVGALASLIVEVGTR
jgi:hypothetical protein